MGRGEAKRRRLAIQLQAKREKKNLNADRVLPMGNGKRAAPKDDMTASLRRLLAHKAAAEKSEERQQGQQGQAAQRPLPHASSGKQQAATATAEALAHGEPPQQQPQEQQAAEPRAVAGGRSRQKRDTMNTGVVVKVLKQRKKDFLAKRKLQKQGRYQQPGGDEREDPEERHLAAAAAVRPTFNEQAEQPIKVNLKRRHWTDQEKTASERCKQVFVNQLERAKRQAALAASGDADAGLALTAGARRKQQPSEEVRLDLVDAYRQHKRSKKGGDAAAATMHSLAALVRRDAGREQQFHAT